MGSGTYSERASRLMSTPVYEQPFLEDGQVLRPDFVEKVLGLPRGFHVWSVNGFIASIEGKPGSLDIEWLPRGRFAVSVTCDESRPAPEDQG